MSASGATAASITSAGVISTWAPSMNPPIPDASFGMPAAFITSSWRPKGNKLEAIGDGEHAYSARRNESGGQITRDTPFWSLGARLQRALKSEVFASRQEASPAGRSAEVVRVQMTPEACPIR